MNPLIQLKKRAPVFLVAVVCFGLSPATQAVSPPPDGGYPGRNTAEGQSALLSRTTGGFNTAVGWFSLKSLITGSFNTGVGAGTLLANTADENTAIGAGALLSNTTGLGNTANGAFALFSNTTGINNAANGVNALSSNTTGSDNTATGAGALFRNATGIQNTAIGLQALFSNTTGSFNTALGINALSINAIGGGNTALGFEAGSNVTTAGNVICIGVPGANVSNSCYIGSIFGQPVDPATGTAVFVDTNGKLGTMVSSRRFKEDIKPMDKASEALYALHPVTFRYKKQIDPAGISEFGLVAEDVEKVNPDLVVRDKEGKPYTVRYDAVNAMLLNEFLKEHRKVQEQDATIARLQKQIDALSAGLQRVSAQLELNKVSPQMVKNND